MKYLRFINNEIIYPFDILKLKDQYFNTSFPEEFDDLALKEYNIYKVYPTEIPLNHLKTYKETTPKLIDNKYYEVWIEVDVTKEEFEIKKIKQWDLIIIQRNNYLKESDWTMLIDSPISELKKQEWINYRQALRDITTQEDPFNITWPTKPE